MSGRVAVPMSQNLLLWSNAFNGHGSWGLNFGVTITENTTDVADPLGGFTASKVHYDGSGGAQWLLAQATVDTFAFGQSCSATLWARVLTGSALALFGNGVQNPLFPTITSSWQLVGTLGDPVVVEGAMNFQFRDWRGLTTPIDYYLWSAQVVRANRRGPEAITGASKIDTGPLRNAP